MKNILHLKAPGDWINDPNGFIYYKGEYHLFYQYFPGNTHWGTMHWGHAVSKDLVNWRHLGIALYPTKPFDRDGCFSGSAVELPDGKMAIYYTGVRYLDYQEDNVNLCKDGCLRPSQIMMISEDGYNFDNFDKKIIIPGFVDSKIGDVCDFRDPKVIKVGNIYYMVVASTHKQEEGVLLVYASSDGYDWELKSRLSDKRLGTILECPDLLKVDGKWVLMCSPINIAGNAKRPNQSIIGIVDFDEENGTVSLSEELRFLDYGLDIYAPQSNLDEDGRRTVIGWMRMDFDADPNNNLSSNGRFWNGMMSLPRVIKIVEGRIYTPVHPLVRNFFEKASSENILLEAITLDAITGHDSDGAGDDGSRNNNACGIKAIEQTVSVNKLSDCFMAGTNGIDGDDNDRVATIAKEEKNIELKRITLRLCEGDAVDIDGYLIGLKDGRIFTDRSKVTDDAVRDKINMISTSGVVGKECELEIYIDPNLVEIFVNDGEYVISNVVTLGQEKLV